MALRETTGDWTKFARSHPVYAAMAGILGIQSCMFLKDPSPLFLNARLILARIHVQRLVCMYVCRMTALA